MARNRILLASSTAVGMLALAVAFQNCGEFKVSVTESGIQNLSVVDTPQDLFAAQPASKVIDLNGSAKLSVALRQAVASAQWYFRRLGTSDFAPLEGKTNLELVLDKLDGSMQGDYKVIVMANGVSRESQIASVFLKGLNNTCLSTDLSALPLPLAGADGVNWSLSSYVDSDAGMNSVADYKGNTGLLARSYDGSTALDFALPHFKAMDAGVDVKSVAAGIVESVAVGNTDRNLDYSRTDQNYVRVRLLNGYAVTYGLLKKDSVTLAVGDAVTAGQVIGKVGASGATNIPALRFELRNCAGDVVDPMLVNGSSIFATALDYDVPPAQLDMFLRATPFTSVNDVKLISGSSLAGGEVNKAFYFAGYFAHIKGGDEIRIEFTNPAGVVVINNRFMVPGTSYYGLYNAVDTFNLNEPGTWKITSKVNGVQVAQQDWVVPTPAASPTPTP